MAYKLLLADDSITIQKVVELTLSEEGFDVTAVGDGAAALDTAGKLMPDIVLADVFMPKMDGYELCGKIKADGRFAGVPVMLLTGTFEEYDEAKAAKAGADDRLTKPFESAELISKVKGLVENRPAATAVKAAVEAGPSTAEDASDDLWNVVDMGSEEQPLSGATEVINEEDLWKRANLVTDTAEAVPEEEGMPIEELPMEAAEAEEIPSAFLDEDVDDAAEVEPYAADESDRTAILNMEDIQSSVYGAREEEVAAIEVAEVGAEAEITTFDSLGEATDEAADFSPGYASAPEPVQPVHAAPVAAVSEEAIKAQVMSLVQPILDAKIKEALSALSSDMIERIVWDVVPELAEEIIRKEVDRIKAGS